MHLPTVSVICISLDMRATVVLFVVALGVSVGDINAERAALKLKVAQGVCAATKALKSVHRYTVEKVKEAEGKLEDVQNMVKLAKLKVLREKKAGSVDCRTMAFFLNYTVKKVSGMIDLLPKIREQGLNLTASAGIAAGRLEEMINVFHQPSDRQESDIFFCIAGKQGEGVTKSELADCFKGGRDAIDSSHFVAFGDAEATKGWQDIFKEKDGLEGALKKHLTVDDNDPRFTRGEGRGCQLVHGMQGGGYIVNENLTEHMLWGDGILGVKKDGNGTTGYVGSTRGNDYDHDILWEKDPTASVPSLHATVSDYHSFSGLLHKYDTIYRSVTEEWTADLIQRDPEATDLLTASELTVEDVAALNSRTKQEWLSQKHAKEADKEFLMTEIRFCGKLKRRGFIRRMVKKILGGLRISWTSEG
ncbi:procyclin-associated 2-like protein [Trypanosoma brucei equiperdum]|uniref:Procyclin-associated 2-like protein n=1 Tax=Trypanosoma brucei equiperdum TaxID=630700 RepID=A0A3L6KUK9_9TRYP|nr:procyclin-associated 2-like protein [Trypanosoma brucei equiperdum]